MSRQLYKSVLEKPLVAASGEYFRLQANNWFHNCSITQYMERVIRLFEEESIRCQRFLHSRYLLANHSKPISHFKFRNAND